MTEDKITIGDMAARHGVTLRTLRFYEDKGLIAPERRGQSRFYSEADSQRVGWIREWSAGGFQLAEIKTLLRLMETDGEAAVRAVVHSNIKRLAGDLARRLAGFEALKQAWL